MKTVRFVREFTVTAIDSPNALVSVSIDGEEFVLSAEHASTVGHRLIAAAGEALELQKPALEERGWVLNPGRT